MASNSGGAPANSQTGLPKDALVMSSILREMGVSDFDPQVVHQMLEFTYRHVTNVIDEAKAMSDHAGKSSIDAQDAKLAISLVAEDSFIGPPPREFMLELAREKNEKPLPPIAEKNGQRLPAERYCLLANNFQVKHVKPTKGSSSRSHHPSASSTPSTPTQLSTPSIPLLQARVPSPSSAIPQVITVKAPVVLSPSIDGSLLARPVSSGSTLSSSSRSPSEVSIPVAATTTPASSLAPAGNGSTAAVPPAQASLDAGGNTIGDMLAAEVGMMDAEDDGEMEEEVLSAEAPAELLSTDALGIGVKRRRSDEDALT